MSENVSLLLEILTDDIDSTTKQYLANANLKTQSISYLESILENDNLLSIGFITPSTDEKQHRKTLIEEIAELDQSQRSINDKLKTFVNENKDSILNYENELNGFHKEFNENFSFKISAMINELENYNISKLPLADNEKLMDKITVKSNLLKNMSSITDLLELPTILKLCILQGNYQESLEISMYLQRLLVRFPNLSILQQLNKVISKELELMLKGLVKLLNTNLKQNSIYKIFQILKRLEPYSKMEKSVQESKLKDVYFNCRLKFINNEILSLKPIQRHNLENYLRRCIEVIREYGFNSIIIYQSIFPNFLHQKKDKHLLNFIKSIALTLIYIIVEDFPKVEDKVTRDGLILQLLYCCQSLAKFNGDFQSILIYELIEVHAVISDTDWLHGIKKQRSLSKNLKTLIE